MLFRSASLFVLVALLVATACGCSGDGEARAATPAECRVVANGTTMISPISGKTITKQTTTPAALYKGRLFFFCCDMDRDAFLQQPGTHAEGVLPPNGWIVDP